MWHLLAGEMRQNPSVLRDYHVDKSVLGEGLTVLLSPHGIHLVPAQGPFEFEGTGLTKVNWLAPNLTDAK